MFLTVLGFGVPHPCCTVGGRSHHLREHPYLAGEEDEEEWWRHKLVCLSYAVTAHTSHTL